METISVEIRERASKLCREYLDGVWQNISQNEIIIEKLTGGFANLTLKLSLPANYKPIIEEPSQVIMKIHQDVFEEGYFRQMTENIIAVSLAEKKLAPKVYGIFDGGRIDEYIISRPFVNKELRNPSILSAIMRKLAHLHSMNIPINKNPNKRLKQLKEFANNVLNDPRNKGDPRRKEVMEFFLSIDHNKEQKWLREIIDSINPPVVYCHGDLQCNNILLEDNSLDDPNVHIIDYDLSGYNYRGTDFANLFNSICFELPCLEPPYFKVHWDLYPTLEEQKVIFDIYIEELEKISSIRFDREKEITILLKETKVFSFFYCYYFICFDLQREDNLPNSIDWVDGAQSLINRYKELKMELLLNK